MFSDVSSDYRALITESKITDLVFALNTLADKTAQQMLPAGLSIAVSEVKLVNAIISYIFDKHRHIKFHGSVNGVTNEKKAAYLCKWIAKIKPYSVIPTDQALSKSQQHYLFENLINPIICTEIVKAFCGQRIIDLFDHKFIYEMHYGSVNTNTLISILERHKKK